jgi:hypothetical protein
MIRIARLATLLAAFAAMPAGAQTTTPASGVVGSARLVNGYPAGGGAITLPAEAASSTTSGTAVTAATSTTTSGAGGSAGGGSGGHGSAAAATGSSSTSSSGNWVLCAPAGASGLAPLFIGSDLSCAPD